MFHHATRYEDAPDFIQDKDAPIRWQMLEDIFREHVVHAGIWHRQIIGHDVASNDILGLRVAVHIDPARPHARTAPEMEPRDTRQPFTPTFNRREVLAVHPD